MKYDASGQVFVDALDQAEEVPSVTDQRCLPEICIEALTLLS